MKFDDEREVQRILRKYALNRLNVIWVDEKKKEKKLINENERIIRIESPCFYGGKYKKMLGFGPIK